MKYDCTSSTEYKQHVEHFIGEAEQRNYSVQHAVFRLDNQAEFSTPAMRELYAKHNITVMSGGPDEHEAQNMVENLAGQCNRRARASLLQAPHLDDTYFAHTVGYEIKVHNALPYEQNAWIPPYKALYGKFVDISKFKVFGSVVFVHNQTMQSD